VYRFDLAHDSELMSPGEDAGNLGSGDQDHGFDAQLVVEG
jgi:hypothetical protein